MTHDIGGTIWSLQSCSSSTKMLGEIEKLPIIVAFQREVRVGNDITVDIQKGQREDAEAQEKHRYT